MDIAFWLVMGFVASALLIKFAHGKPVQFQINLFGIALIIAALIYVGFAALYANTTWLLIEVIGVFVYGLFYILSKRFGFYLLAIGWLLHPIWDVGLHLIGAGGEFAPEWYAIMCISFDLTVAAYLVIRQLMAR